MIGNSPGAFIYKIGFLEVGWVDLADVALVAYLFYQVYKLMRGTGAFRILFGILALLLAYQVTKTLKMTLITSILGQFMGIGVLAMVILFQQEIRRFLLMLGRGTVLSRVLNLKLLTAKQNDEVEQTLPIILQAIKRLGDAYTGALVVISRQGDLRSYVDTGEVISAKVTRNLLISLFQKTSPLHDGAVIIGNDRIVAARCILPVTQRSIGDRFGTRHRAALGLSEVTDAIVLLASEETGKLAIAVNGELYPDLSVGEILSRVRTLLKEG